MLIHGGIQKEAEQHGRRTVDGHGNRSRGIAEVKAAVELFGIVQAADADARIANLAVDIWTATRIVAVERHGVKSRAQTLGRHPQRNIVEALVSALGTSLSGKHAGGIFGRALEGVDACGIREISGYILLKQPAELIAPRTVAGCGHFRNLFAA